MTGNLVLLAAIFVAPHLNKYAALALACLALMSFVVDVAVVLVRASGAIQ